MGYFTHYQGVKYILPNSAKIYNHDGNLCPTFIYCHIRVTVEWRLVSFSLCSFNFLFGDEFNSIQFNKIYLVRNILPYKDPSNS